MKARKGLVCRDYGTIFFQVFIEDSDCDNCDQYELVAKDRSGGHLPAALYHRGGSEYVIAVPQLKIGAYVSILKRGTTESVSFRIDGEVSKWKSRLNYRVNRKAAFGIRNINRDFFDARANIELISISVGASESAECVLNGRVVVPSLDVDSVELVAIDGRARQLGDAVRLTWRDVDAVYDDEQPRYISFPFSIRVPRKKISICLEAKVLGRPELNSFLTIPAKDYKAKIESFLEDATCAVQSGVCSSEYRNWFVKHKASSSDLDRQRHLKLERDTKFSVIVPLYHTPIDLFDEMADSVVKQSYSNWELVLVNSTPDDEDLAKAVSHLADSDSRVRVVELAENLGISGNTNKGIEVATGDYICFFDHDDLLEPDILFEYAFAVNADPSIDLLYCDEDLVDGDGIPIYPFFKTEFSLDRLRNNNFVCHMLTIKKTMLDRVGLIPDGYDGAQDHYMTLRVAEETDRIHHVPKVLYHWRAAEGSTALDPDSKSYATDAGVLAVQESLDRLGIEATVEPYGRPFTYRVKYAVPDGVSYSIVISKLSKPDILRACVESIVNLTANSNYEIVIVADESADEAMSKCLEQLEGSESCLKVVKWEGCDSTPADLVNLGVVNSDGDVVILMDDDVEVTDGEWLDSLGGFACREDVGAVGPTLFYPNGTYQHIGLAVIGEGVTHLYQGAAKDSYFADYMKYQDMTRNVSAVTGACLAVRRSVFDELGGFDPNFTCILADVDFCLRLVDAGYWNIYTANTSLQHVDLDSLLADGSNGLDLKRRRDIERREKEFFDLLEFRKRWAKYYIKGDPFYSIHFNQNEPFSKYFALPAQNK